MTPELVYRGLTNRINDAFSSMLSICPMLGQGRWSVASEATIYFPRARCASMNRLRNGGFASMRVDSVKPSKGVYPRGMRRQEVKLPGLLLRLYADELVGEEESKSTIQMVNSAVSGGVTIVALEVRSGGRVTDSQLYFTACLLKENLRGRAKLMVVERADIAAAVGADGVLLSDKGLPTVVARRMMQNALLEAATFPIVARTVTSAESAQIASTEGADFLILKIPEHINDDHLVTSVCKLVSIPVFAETPVSRNLGERVLKPSPEFLEVGANGLVLTGCGLNNTGSENVFEYVAALSSTLDLAIQHQVVTQSTLDADLQMPLVRESAENHALDEVVEDDITLNLQETKILREERLLLSALTNLVKEASPEMEVTLLVDAVAQLDDLFLLVVVGEFNSGKSSLINALLGNRFLKEGVLPTTNEITLLKHSREGLSEEEGSERHPDGHLVYHLPVELLKQLNVVDTPGTNVILQRQQRLTEEFVPRADLVLFVLAVDKPLSESEMTFLRYIRQWEKKIVFILNKIDVLQPSQLEEVRQFVDKNIRRLLSIDKVLVFPVSARHGLQAKLAAMGEDGTLNKELLCIDNLWKNSGLEPLESFIHSFHERSTEAGAERMRLKLETPLSIAAAILGACERQLSEDATNAEADLKEIARFEENFRNFQLSMNSESGIHIEDALTAIEAAKERAEQFIESLLRLSNIENNAKYLFTASRVHQRMPVSTTFRTEVIGSAYSDTERTLNTYNTWVESSTSKQLNIFYDLVKKRWKDVELQTGTPKSISYSKIQSGTQSSLDVLKEFDLEAAEIVLEQEIKEVVLETFGGLGAAGLSASVLTSILPSTLEDLLALGVCSAGGFAGVWNLPLRRADIKVKARRAANSLAKKIRSAMQNELHRSLEEMKSKLDSLTKPFGDSAQTEIDRITNLQNLLHLYTNQLTLLRQRVQRIQV